MKMMQREPEEKTNSIAQILAAIPPVLYKAVFTLIIVVVGLSIISQYFPHTGLHAFMASVLMWVGYVLIGTGVVIVGSVLCAIVGKVHDFRMKNAEYRAVMLGNEKKKAEADALKAFNANVPQGLALGFNLDFRKNTMVSPWSNVHTKVDNVVESDPMKQLPSPSVRRLTVEEICATAVRNSYKVGIGSSLTSQSMAPVAISIFKRHLKIIGATQKGKSSFVGAMIDIVTRTHDASHVQFALLDKEYQTSRLFADIPHLLSVVMNDEVMPLHAKTVDEVCEHLTYLLQILNVRNEMSRTAIAKEPLIIIYIEEYLRLKKELLAACTLSQDKDAAKRRYVQFSFAIGQLSGLGLKMKMCLWLVAQMSYTDKDSELQEAMGNITSGVSFCVRPSAALAAGFYTTELLNRNAQENKQGTAVVEMPDCIDLVLAPDFNLEQKLQDREAEETEAEEMGTVESNDPYTGPYLLRSKVPAQQKECVPYTPTLQASTPVIDTPPSLPVVQPHAIRKATLSDAIEVWNECGDGNMGRPRLRDELIARGLECSDDLAKTLIKNVKARLEKAE